MSEPFKGLAPASNRIIELEYIPPYVSVCPYFLSQPVNSSVDSGEPASFGVTADINSSATVFYQWQASADGGSTWYDLVDEGIFSDATTDTLLISEVSSEYDGYLFRCLIYGGGCSPEPSSSASLSVSCQSITSQPVAETVSEPDGASFTVAASLTECTFQWQISTNGGADWSDLTDGGAYSGVTTGTLSINPTEVAMTGNLYRCSVGHVGCGDETSDSALLTVEPAVVSARFLLVAGGAGGGAFYGGGGGGGEVHENLSVELDLDTSYPVVVGLGGTGAVAAGASSIRGADGGVSSFNGVTALGGGGGGSIRTYCIGGDGACGGGASYNDLAVPGTAAGGTGSVGGHGGSGAWNGGDNAAAGGGGGMGGNGGPGQAPNYTVAGDGGDGVASDISGASLFYGAGGGGGVSFSLGAGSPGDGGSSGVGGNGGRAGGGPVGTGGNALANRGSGGGGGGSGANGGNGSDGVFILRYPGAPMWTGGTITTEGGDTVHTFNASGTLVPV